MSDQLTPRAKRLLLIAIVTPWLYLAVYYGAPMPNSQRHNLALVDEHIEKITPLWHKFRIEHAGFDDVHLFAWTGSNGLFGAWGRVPSDAHVVDLRTFMESTSPPRPVYLESVQVVDQEVIEFLKKSTESEPNDPPNDGPAVPVENSDAFGGSRHR